MLRRRNLVVALVAVLLMSMLAGCAMGDVAAPEDAPEVSLDAALEGQNLGLQGLMTGEVTWTDAQFSSFLTELLRQNTGANQPVDSILAWFGPEGAVHLRVALKDDVLLGGSNIDLKGQLGIENGQIMVDVQEAGANGMMISGPLVDFVDAYINAALSGVGVAADLMTDDGSVTIKMAGM